MTESQFGTQFKPWFLAHRKEYPDNCTFEYKKTEAKTFNLKAWRKSRQAHQESCLYNSSNGVGVFYKIPDASADLKPFDAFFTSTATPYLVVYYNKYKQFSITKIQDLKGLDTLPLINPKKLLAKKIITHKIF